MRRSPSMADRRSHLRPVPDRPELTDDADDLEPLGQAVAVSAPVPGTHHAADTVPAPGTGTRPGTGTGLGTGTGGAASAGTAGTGDGADDDDTGRELKNGEQFIALARHWMFMMDVTFARLTSRGTGLWFGLTHAKPES